MKEGHVEIDVTVHQVDGMQLSEGCIREDESHHFLGTIPGLQPVEGDTFTDVLNRLDEEAKEFYGDDVVVEQMQPNCL